MNQLLRHQREINRHRGELIRRLANHDYEVTPAGLLFPKMGARVGGGVLHAVNGQDERFDDNIVVTTGLNLMLDVTLHDAAKVATWYLAPFVTNSSPAANLTAATFDSTLTELTQYAEATRQAYVEAAASGGSTTNSASKATFTINDTVNNWGMALLSDSAKESVSGTLFSAIKYAAVRALVSGDALSAQYTVTLTST